MRAFSTPFFFYFGPFELGALFFFLFSSFDQSFSSTERDLHCFFVWEESGKCQRRFTPAFIIISCRQLMYRLLLRMRRKKKKNKKERRETLLSNAFGKFDQCHELNTYGTYPLRKDLLIYDPESLSPAPESNPIWKFSRKFPKILTRGREFYD